MNAMNISVIGRNTADVNYDSNIQFKIQVHL
jgi:hypothetical protein